MDYRPRCLARERPVGILVLVLLVAAWGLVLGPTLLKNSQHPSPLRTEMMFNRALKAMAGPRRARTTVGGRVILVPRSSNPPQTGGRTGPSTAIQRRNRNLKYLSIFVIATFLPGWLVSQLQFLLYVNFVADVLLIAYFIAAIVYAAKPAKVKSPQAPEQVSPPEAAGGGW